MPFERRLVLLEELRGLVAPLGVFSRAGALQVVPAASPGTLPPWASVPNGKKGNPATHSGGNGAIDPKPVRSSVMKVKAQSPAQTVTVFYPKIIRIPPKRGPNRTGHWMVMRVQRKTTSRRKI